MNHGAKDVHRENTGFQHLLRAYLLLCGVSRTATLTTSLARMNQLIRCFFLAFVEGFTFRNSPVRGQTYQLRDLHSCKGMP